MAKRVRFGAFEADLGSGELFRDEERVALQRQPFEVLALLIERAGALVTRDELRARLWPDGTVVDFEHSLNTAVRKLRRALGDSPEQPSFVETLAGRGYRLRVPVEHSASPTISRRIALSAAADLEPGGPRETLRAVLRKVAVSLGAELVEDPEGPLASLVSALFIGPEDAIRCAQELRRKALTDVPSGSARLRIGVELGENGDGRAAARQLRDNAAPGEILAGARLATSIAGLEGMRLRDRQPLALPDGRELPVFSLETRAAPSLATLARPPFVGRDAPLSRLEARLAKAYEGRRGVIFVAGEPGIGKTRLLEEFAARTRRRRVHVLAGRCVQGESALPYGAIADALSAHARSADIETLRSLVDAPTAAVVARITPVLRERLPGLPEPASLRPDEERHRLRDAIAQTLAALAKRAPVVLLVDDLHWGDAATLDMLMHLSRNDAGAPLLLVGAYRDVEIDHAHPLHPVREALLRESVLEEFALTGLEPEPVQRLLETATQEGVAPELVEAVHRATNGNPLFVRELLLQWLREDRLGEGAIAPLTTDAVVLPESLRALVEQRLVRLSEEAQRLLVTASGFRGVFHFEATARAAGLDEGAGLDALDEAFEAQLVRQEGSADDYDFSHALIRQTLYDALTPARLLRIHRHLAEEMARDGGRRRREHAAEIAEHYHRSRELAGAEAGVPHALWAADRAERAADFEGSARFLRMALDLLGDGDAGRPRLLGRLGLALAWSGAIEEAARVAEEAGEAIAGAEHAAAADYLAEAADAIWRSAWHPAAWVLAGRGLLHIGARRDHTWVRLATHRIAAEEATDPELPGVPRDTPLRREVFEKILMGFDGFSPVEQNEIQLNVIFDSRLQVLEQASHLPAALVFYAGEYRRGLAGYRELARRSVARGALASAASLRLNTLAVEVALGELDAAEKSLAQANELIGRVRIPSWIHIIEAFARGVLASARGVGIEEAATALGQTLRSSKVPFPAVLAPAASVAAYLHAWARHPEGIDDNLDLVLRAIEQLPGWAPNYTLFVAFAADALWQRGARDRRGERIECNLREKTHAPDFRYPAVDTRRALAQLCALDGRYDEARAWFARAREVLDEQGARPLRAITDLDEAWMYLRRSARGDRKRAQPLLDAAVAQFESIGMPGWVRRADALARGAL